MKKARRHQTLSGREIHFLALALIAGFMGCHRDDPVTTTDPNRPARQESRASVEPSNQLDRNHPVVLVETSEGPITIRLDAETSPGTVRSFLNSVNETFYDNTIVHYVAPGNMIVAGGYAVDRTLKPARQSIRNEAHNGVKNLRGTVAMARDASLIDSATTQFFINLADAPQRDHRGDTAADYGYCVFGEVTQGLDVADKIASSSTTDLGGDLAQTPDPLVVIKTVRIVQ